MEHKAFIYSLEEIGFDEEQIVELSKSYLNIVKWSNAFYSSSKKDDETIQLIKKNRQEAREYFYEDLQFFINRNNERLQSGKKF